MEEKLIPVLLVSANVGSLFEDVSSYAILKVSKGSEFEYAFCSIWAVDFKISGRRDIIAKTKWHVDKKISIEGNADIKYSYFAIGNETPENLLKTWIKEFLTVIKHCQPQFLALHCQEVGGKSYKDSTRHVEDFIRTLMTSEELTQYNQMRIFLDEDFTCPEKFTALGSLYFIHNSLKDVQIWDFHGQRFHPVHGKEVYKGNIQQVVTKEKAKFPQDIIPESKWSRKGFIRTRWSIGLTVFDLVNIHLFHDASNFIAMEEFPSKYSKTRQTALGYTLQRFSTDPYDKVPFFIFGDFNFRLDTKGIVQKLTSQTVPVYVTSAKNGEMEKILYKDPVNENKVVLTLEKKVFDFDRHEETFASNEKWLLEYDKEPKVFEDELFEFDISFPPSYPYKEDICSANSYMRTRCPSWCDRILLSRSALSIINMTPLDSAYPSVVYRLVGENVAMGDHKPVMLMFNLLPHTALYEDVLVPPSNTDKFHLILPRISVTFPTVKTPTSFSRFIHVKHPGSPARIFRETTV